MAGLCGHTFVLGITDFKRFLIDRATDSLNQGVLY